MSHNPHRGGRGRGTQPSRNGNQYWRGDSNQGHPPPNPSYGPPNGPQINDPNAFPPLGQAQLAHPSVQTTGGTPNFPQPANPVPSNAWGSMAQQTGLQPAAQSFVPTTQQVPPTAQSAFPVPQPVVHAPQPQSLAPNAQSLLPGAPYPAAPSAGTTQHTQSQASGHGWMATIHRSHQPGSTQWRGGKGQGHSPPRGGRSTEAFDRRQGGHYNSHRGQRGNRGNTSNQRGGIDSNASRRDQHTGPTPSVASAAQQSSVIPIVAPPSTVPRQVPAPQAQQVIPRVPVIPVGIQQISPEQLILQSTVHNRQAPKDVDGTLNHMYGKGIRTEYGTEEERTSEILTNFFDITSRPSYLFVYKITFIRRWEGDGDDAKAIYVRNKFDKQALFEEMIKSLRMTAPDCWVTDYDMIWSTQRLLENETFDMSPKRATNLSATNPNSLKAIQCEEAWIEYDRVIDLSKSIGELFQYANGRVEGVDDPAVLVRGINAMVTKFARRRIPDGIVSTSANKFYATQPTPGLSHTLRALCGFSASVRPGADRLLLNISSKCSPFLRNMTVAQFIASHGSSKLGPILAALKGVKVKIIYNMHPNLTEAERTKFMTGIGTSLESQSLEDGTTVWNYYQQPLFPHTPLTPLTKESYAINVGGKPTKRKDGDGTESDQNKKRTKPEWHPSEYLQIVDYPSYRDKLTGDQTSAMINIALKHPTDQRGDIESHGLGMFGLRDVQFQTDLKTMFGLAISTDLCKVPCRFLAAPRLTYRGGRSPNINKASWNLNNTALCTSGKTVRVPILDLSCLRQPQANEVPDDIGDVHPMITYADVTNEGPTSLPNSLSFYLGKQMSMLGMTSASIEGPFRPSLLKQSGLLETVNIDEDKLGRIFQWAISQNTTASFNADQITMVVVIPQESAGLYAAIKRVADLKMGLKTVCCAASKMQDFGQFVRGREQGPQHCGNIALKLNLKGEGDNHRIHRSQFPELYANYLKGRTPLPGDEANTIVFGADVTHPIGHCAPGCPSIAALVGSIDDNFAQFPGSMRLQRSRQERIEDLQYMVKERLLAWANRHAGHLPTSILFYRDGVSESQFEEVRKHEINAVTEGYELAKAELESALQHPTGLIPNSQSANAAGDSVTSSDKGVDEKPVVGTSEGTTGSASAGSGRSSKPVPPFRLTFVVVGKRHNTRFYPQPGKENEDSWASGTGLVNGNVLPGCVVDQGITHPYIFDFYLQSHQPLRGTGRSAHYFVLQNNMKLSADRLQSITHSFCYNYARATKGVSYCAPAYYADRLCDRGRAYIRHWLTDGDNYKAGRDRAKNETAEQFNDYVKDFLHDTEYYRPNQGQSQNPWHPNMDNIMFYL